MATSWEQLIDSVEWVLVEIYDTINDLMNRLIDL